MGVKFFHGLFYSFVFHTLYWLPFFMIGYNVFIIFFGHPSLWMTISQK